MMVAWLTFGLNLVILIVSIAGFLKIMKNDLHHLQKDMQEIKKCTCDINNTLNKVCQRVAKIEGKLEK
jgi:uncharacterized protein YoxC